MNISKILGLCRMFVGICLIIASALSFFVWIWYGLLMWKWQVNELEEIVGGAFAMLLSLFFPIVWPTLPFIVWYTNGAFPWEFIINLVICIIAGVIGYILWKIGKPLYANGRRIAISQNSSIPKLVSIIRTVLWTDLFTTRRRASRLEFWIGSLGIVTVSYLIAPLGYFTLLFLDINAIQGAVRLLNLCITFWTTIAIYTLAVRRFHDCGLLGWPAGLCVAVSWLAAIVTANLDNFPFLFLLSKILELATIVLGVVVLTVGALPSRSEKNQWGLPANTSVSKYG